MERQDDLYQCDAALYDAAFDFDVSVEVAFLMQHLPSTGKIIEPMCGAARLLAALAARGFATVGVDTSAALLDLARARFARAGCQGEWLQADVRDFDVDPRADGAVCPVNSLAHLPDGEAMRRHLTAVAKNLRVGAPYLVMLDLRTEAGVRRTLGAASEHTRWEFSYRGELARCEWFGERLEDGRVHTVSRFTFLERGEGTDYRHVMKLWDWRSWSTVVESSPFTELAAFAGADGRYAPLALDASLEDIPLVWHLLRRA